MGVATIVGRVETGSSRYDFRSRWIPVLDNRCRNVIILSMERSSMQIMSVGEYIEKRFGVTLRALKELKMKKKEIARSAMRMIHYCRPEDFGELNASEVARRLGVSLPYLSRCFKEHFSTTLKKRMDNKLFESFDLLIIHRKALSLNEALEILNIQSPGTFIKKFKQRHYKTPGQYIRYLYKTVPSILRIRPQQIIKKR